MMRLVNLLEKLIAFPSVSPEDEGCQDFIIDYLSELGFMCQRFDNSPVANFFARLGSNAPLLVFAGHTDVVPIGNREKWHTDPFVLTEKDDLLYGRGSADMKGSIACMLIAAQKFIQNNPDFTGSLGFLITSGEEGDDYDKGTPYVMAELAKLGIKPDYCIVGEPSSTRHTGDVIKIGRRGSLNASLTLHGKQGHVAYPHLAENPIHTIAPALAELSSHAFDQGNAHFPPTSLQITQIESGSQATNIIPGELKLKFNIRYSTEQSADTIKATVLDLFKRHNLNLDIIWRLSGEPFLTSQGCLLESCVKVIKAKTGKEPELSTSGGTSDGRFIAPYGVEVIELGPVNATIHQVNECVGLADLLSLTEIYYGLCEALIA